MSDMICSACGSAMVAIDNTVAKMGVCGDCGGIWATRRELQKEGAVLPADSLRPEWGPRKCPVCRSKMAVATEAGVEVDICRGCKGVFLDSGELERVIAAGAAVREDEKQRFLCDLCHQWSPVSVRVVGEVYTVCQGCAKRHEIVANPKARLRREAAIQRAGKGVRGGGDGSGDFDAADGTDALGFALDIAFNVDWFS